MTRRLGSSTASVAQSKGPINLLTGWPNPKLLPPESLQVASGVVCQDETISTPALVYGPDEGYQPLREAIALWLTEFYQLSQSVTSDQVCITGGASQNLACILQVFSDPVYTRNVWLVSPTYFHACKIFDDAGFSGKMRAAPEDEEGIDIDYLANAIKRSEEAATKAGNTRPVLKSPRPYRKIFKHIIYAVPTFSNPSGKLMSLSRREALVRLAREHDALIITDDVYDMLQWPVSLDPTKWAHSQTFDHPLKHACLPRLTDIDSTLDGGPIDEFGNAVSNGSFSKIVAPGCRTGWAQGTAKMAFGVGKAGSSQSGGAPSQFTSTLIHQLLITSTLQSHIFETLQPAYSRRYHLMLDAIQTYLVPLGCTLISKPARTSQPSNANTSTGAINDNKNVGSNHNLTPVSKQAEGLGGGYFHYFSLPERLLKSYSTEDGKSNNNDLPYSESTSAPPAATLTTTTTTTTGGKTIADHIRILALEQENLTVMAGSLFRVDGDTSELSNNRYEADIRLSFAWEDEDKLVEGVSRLASVVRREMQARGLLSSTT